VLLQQKMFYVHDESEESIHAKQQVRRGGGMDDYPRPKQSEGRTLLLF